MLNQEEREKLKSSLPLNVRHGYELINKKLPHLTKNQISQAFQYPNRYKPEVMKAALEVIDEYNSSENPIKEKVAAL